MVAGSKIKKKSLKTTCFYLARATYKISLNVLFCGLYFQEKLSSRFQELSVKSSLSEYVVNSRALLDLHGVQIAAEAIFKNEKPLPARGDHSSKEFSSNYNYYLITCVICCCKLNKTRDWDEHLFKQVCTHTGHYQLSIALHICAPVKLPSPTI